MKTAVCGVIAEACPFFLSLSNFLEEKGLQQFMLSLNTPEVYG